MRSVGIHLCLSYQCKVNFVCCLITAYMYLCMMRWGSKLWLALWWLLRQKSFTFFSKITHWWHCSLFFGGFQVLALSLLCYAALRWALLNCDSEDISLISKRWQHELNILILEIVFKTSDGMWCVCECGISFFRIGDTITVFPVYFWGIAQVLCKISIIQVWWGHFGILLLHQIQISSLLTHRQHLRCSLALLLLAYLTIERMPNRTFSHLNAWAQLRNNIGKHSP